MEENKMKREERYKLTKEKNESDMICEKIIDTKPTDEISRLKGDVSRLVEENSNYEIINKGHKKINGELQEKLTKAEAKIKDFEKIKMYNEPHNIQN